jgi:hypothetical protein
MGANYGMGMGSVIAVLFARDDSRYKDFNMYDVYDINRDARTFCKKMPVIAHPPCRAWGMLSHMANPREGEKQLAYLALAQVRLNGGILEHPAGSRLWKEAPLPLAGGGGKMNLVDIQLRLTNLTLAMLHTKILNFIFAE